MSTFYEQLSNKIQAFQCDDESRWLLKSAVMETLVTFENKAELHNAVSQSFDEFLKRVKAEAGNTLPTREDIISVATRCGVYPWCYVQVLTKTSDFTDAGKASFEWAGEVTKQLVTIASAVCVFFATFLKDFPNKPSEAQEVWIWSSVAILLLSIVLGILVLQVLTGGLVEGGVGKFALINNRFAARTGMAQSIVFLFGFVSLVLALLAISLNRPSANPPGVNPSQANPTQVSPSGVR